MELCRVCEAELTTDIEINEGVCNNCQITIDEMYYDLWKEEQLTGGK